MLLGFILLFSICRSTASTVSSQTLATHSLVTTTVSTTTEEMLPALEIVAKPDYPIAAGQEVRLYCNSTPVSMSVNWTWLHLQYKSWKEVGFGKELTLTKPEESGQYLCKAETRTQMKQSQNYTVYIISFQATEDLSIQPYILESENEPEREENEDNQIVVVGENLGVAAFALTIVILVAIIAGVVWFVWQKLREKLASPSTINKSVPGPKATVPKAFSPPADSDRDVYMNYTRTDQSYVDLNPAHLSPDNLYSTLS